MENAPVSLEQKRKDIINNAKGLFATALDELGSTYGTPMKGMEDDQKNMIEMRLKNLESLIKMINEKLKEVS